MVREIHLKNKYFIKRAYKQHNEFDGVEAVYYILADGSVIVVKSGFKGAPNYHIVGDLDGKIGRFGGFCPNGDGGILIGTEINDRKEWEFRCIECDYFKIYQDNRIDDLACDALFVIAEEDLYN